MRKILIFENSGKCGFGGGQKMSLNIASMLNEKYDVVFADFATESIYLDKVRNIFPDNPIVNMRSHTSSIECKTLRWLIEVTFTLLFSVKNIRRIVSAIGKSDVITYATDKKTLIYAYLLKRFYGIPFILHAHLVENPNAIYYPLYLMMAKRARKVICCSHSVVDSIKSNNTQLLYNPNFNNRGCKKYNQEKTPFIVAVAGSLITIKGFEYFVKAAKYIDDGIELRVYGSGPLENKLRSLANIKVKFMGFCDNIIKELYDTVDVVAVVTIIKEANSLSVLEAKSVGIPVIVTNIGGQAELVVDGIDGICIPIKNEKAIADAINRLYQNKSLYINMAKASYDSVSKYDCEQYKHKLLDIFTKAF